jgi:hypothetical protein
MRLSQNSSAGRGRPPPGPSPKARYPGHRQPFRFLRPGCIESAFPCVKVRRPPGIIDRQRHLGCAPDQNRYDPERHPLTTDDPADPGTRADRLPLYVIGEPSQSQAGRPSASPCNRPPGTLHPSPIHLLLSPQAFSRALMRTSRSGSHSWHSRAIRNVLAASPIPR